MFFLFDKLIRLIIFLLMQYDIGDRIHVSNIESETNTDGSLGKQNLVSICLLTFPGIDLY